VRQIRPIADFDSPVMAAIDVSNQCVAFFGVSSSVAAITSPTLSSRIDGGQPGLGYPPDHPSGRL
jgi:hypothetical protein